MQLKQPSNVVTLQLNHALSTPALLNLWVAEVKIGVAEKLVLEALIPVLFWSRAMKYFS